LSDFKPRSQLLSSSMPYFDANRNTVLTCYLTNDYRYTTVNSDTNIAVKDIYIK